VSAGPEAAPRQRAGLIYGFAAYGLWGVFPAFFVLLAPAGAPEILAHRVVWTLIFLVALLMVTRRLADFRTIDRRTWLLLTLASALISTNWLIYIWAVNSDQVVDAALGYFTTPLVSVLLAVVLFGERLNRIQLVAVTLAAVAVIVLSTGLGGPPLIAIGLALSFGLYGAVKKMVPTDPRVSVAVETAIAAPFALGYLVLIQLNGDADFLNHGPVHAVLMMLCGPVTAIPLLCFAAAAQRLPLVTLGLLQYLTPTMQLVWGLVVDHEPMPAARWLGFALIWTALAISSADALSRSYRNRTGTLQAS
jgi:chloramphenicol-sensitive protein RarD